MKGDVFGNNRRFSGTLTPLSYGFKRALYGYDEGDLTEYNDGGIYATSSGKFKSNELGDDMRKAVLAEGVYSRFSSNKQNEKWGNIAYKQTGVFLQKKCTDEPKITKGVIEYADGRIVEGTFKWGVPQNTKEIRSDGTVTITQADLRSDPKHSCSSKIPDSTKWTARDIPPVAGSARSIEITYFPKGSNKQEIDQELNQFVVSFSNGNLQGPATVTRTGRRYCASEGNMCEIDSKTLVHYGAKNQYNSKHMSGSFICDNKTFGDPIFGIPKHCFYTPSNISPKELQLNSTEFLPLADIDNGQVPALRISDISALNPEMRYYRIDPNEKAQKQTGWLGIEYLESTNWAQGELVGAKTNFAHKWTGPLDDKGRPHGIGKQPLFRAVADVPAKSGYFWSKPKPIAGEFEDVEYVHGKAQSETSYMRASAEAQRHNDKLEDVLTGKHRQELYNREMAFLAEERAEKAKKQREYENRKRRRASENERRRQRKAENFSALQDHIANNPSVKRINEINRVSTSAAPKTLSRQSATEPKTPQTATTQQRQSSRADSSGVAVEPPESGSARVERTTGSSRPETKVASAPDVYMRNGRAVPIHECARLVEVKTGKFALGTGLHKGWEDLTDRKVFLQNVCDKPINVGACFAYSNNENSKDRYLIQSGTTRSLLAVARIDRNKGADGKEVFSNGRQPVSHEIFVWSKGGGPVGFRNCS